MLTELTLIEVHAVFFKVLNCKSSLLLSSRYCQAESPPSFVLEFDVKFL